VVNHAFNVTPRSDKKNIHCKFFAQTEFLLKKVQLKLMPHSQQLFTLHRYRRSDYSTYQHARQMDFPGVGEIMDFFMEWPKEFFKGANSGEI